MRDSSTSLDLNVIHKTMRMLVGGVVFLHHGQWSASLPFLDPFLAFCRIVQVRSNGNPNFSSPWRKTNKCENSLLAST